MPCLRPPHVKRMRSLTGRSTASFRRDCCSGAARSRMQPICSNMRWFQDAAYGTLLRERRRGCTLVSLNYRANSRDRENQPNCWPSFTRRLIEQAAALDKAGERSLARSA